MAIVVGRSVQEDKLLLANANGTIIDVRDIDEPLPDSRLPTEKKLFYQGNSLMSLFPEAKYFDPNRLSLSTMHKMRRDPMIAFGLTFIKSPLYNAIWRIECSDAQVRAFVEWSIRNVYQKLLSALLTSLEFGYSGVMVRWNEGRPNDKWVDEKGKEHAIWTKSVDAWYPFDVVNLQPEVITPKFDDALTKGRFQGIQMIGVKDYLRYPNALWYTNERQNAFGSYYGYPRSGYAYPYWRSYWLRWIISDRHFETDADPPLIVSYPVGKSLVMGVPRNNSDIALDIGNSLRSGATIAIPSEPYQNEDGKVTAQRRWAAEFLKGGENIRAHNESFEYLDVLKLRSVMVPEQALIEGKGGSGSKNTAGSIGEAFQDAQRMLMDDIDTAVFTPLAQYIAALHFDNPPAIRKVTTGFLSEDITFARNVLLILAKANPRGLNIDVRELVKAVGAPSIQYQPHDATPPATKDLMPAAARGNTPPGAAGGQGQAGGSNRTGSNRGGRPPGSPNTGG
jgi:hypothetical protein